jgi:putative membrane protein
MKKITKRCLPILLSAIILCGAVTPAFAAASPSPKEEVIYINLNTDGSVKAVYAVNILNGGGEFVDYGNYTAIRNMTTSDKLAINDGVITGQSNAEKLFYEGTMENTQIPWNISIRYFLNGEEHTAEDIAGKSGKLEIQFSVSKNERQSGNFFDDYALQAAFTLNTNLCANISARGATEANVGKNKQFMYTILPGKGINTTITADVTDFEMDAISINGVKLNLNIEIDNTELMDKVGELIDGIVKLDDGSTQLKDGAAELHTGSGTLKDGANELRNGIKPLNDGISKLQAGVSSAQDGLNALNAQSNTLVNGSAEVKPALMTIGSSLSKISVTADKLEQLTTASGSIKTGINNLYEGVGKLQSSIGYAQYKALMSQNGLDIDTLKAGNANAISELSTQVSGLQNTLSGIQDVPGYEEQTAQLQAQMSQLQNIITLLTGNTAAIGGVESYLNGLGDAIKGLYDGVTELKAKYNEFDAAITELANNLSKSLVDLSELSSGINTLITKYTELDNGIVKYTGGTAQLVAGFGQIKDGVADLAQGGKELTDASNKIYDGTVELYDGVTALYDGTKELSDGTSEMRDKTSGIDSQVNEKIDEMLNSIQRSGSETVSFTSERNTNVESVQFVIQTDAIEKAEAAAVEAPPEEELNLWQKILRLFGLY